MAKELEFRYMPKCGIILCPRGSEPKKFRAPCLMLIEYKHIIHLRANVCHLFQLFMKKTAIVKEFFQDKSDCHKNYISVYLHVKHKTEALYCYVKIIFIFLFPTYFRTSQLLTTLKNFKIRD